MGFYVNPGNESKESFLRSKGIEVSASLKFSDVPQGSLPVVLMDNGPFTAAGIAYSERELQAFTDPQDRRSKKFYIVSIADLLTVSDQQFDEYVQRNNLLAA